jgi:signal transduction histidine kinase
MATIQLTPAPGIAGGFPDIAHRVQFYKEDRFLVSLVAQYLASSLRSGGSAIVLATEEHRARFLEVLAELEVPPDSLRERYFAFDASETLSQLMVNGSPDAVRFRAVFEELLRLAQSSSGSDCEAVSAFGEMVSVLWSEGKRQAAVELEQLWSEFTKAHSLSLLCAHPLQYFATAEDRAWFSQICAAHSSVLPAENYALLPEDQRAREIADLQQRAEALAREAEARKLAEEKLRATRAELENLVEQRTSALRKLSLQVLKLQDLERRRVARELHDSLGQEFVGLRVNLDLARRSPQNPELWKNCDQLLERCISEVRTLSYLLHPPMIEDAGFSSAAEWYIEDFSRRTGMKIGFSTRGQVSQLPEYLKLVLFRVMQEALLNVYRHAQATTGKVRVERSQNLLILEISDNGVGIPEEKLTRFNRDGTGMGVGLTGIRERVRDLGGSFELKSSPAGTEVRVSVLGARHR